MPIPNEHVLAGANRREPVGISNGQVGSGGFFKYYKVEQYEEVLRQAALSRRRLIRQSERTTLPLLYS